MRLRLLAFSDWRVQKISYIFDFIQKLKEPVDFILYAGDDIRRFKEGKVNYFTELAKYTKQKKILAVIGNDDTYDVKSILKDKNIQDLHEEPFIYQDFAFIGLEGSTRGPGWVVYSEEEVKKHLKKQLQKIKKKRKGEKLIVLSHTPPYGILDRGIRFAKYFGHHTGSTALREFIQKHKVSLVICGHCHSHGGLLERLKDTIVVNVSSHDLPGAKGNYALIDIDPNGKIHIEWFDTSAILDENSLKHLRNIGDKRESMLCKAGIETINDLAEIQDFDEISKKIGLPVRLVKKLSLEAKSRLENKIYQIALFTLPKDNLVFFDIETDLECKKIWLIGVLKDGKFIQFYADNWKEEKKILKDFLTFLKQSPNLTLVSYSNSNFDKNVIQRALDRLGLDSKLFSSYQHIDLCIAFDKSFIFPIKSYILKNLGKYFNYPFRHPELDGFLVAKKYELHLEENKPLDYCVFEYNKDDVKILPFLIEQVTKQAEPSPFPL